MIHHVHCFIRITLCYIHCIMLLLFQHFYCGEGTRVHGGQGKPWCLLIHAWKRPSPLIAEQNEGSK